MLVNLMKKSFISILFLLNLNILKFYYLLKPRKKKNENSFLIFWKSTLHHTTYLCF